MSKAKDILNLVEGKKINANEMGEKELAKLRPGKSKFMMSRDEWHAWYTFQDYEKELSGFNVTGTDPDGRPTTVKLEQIDMFEV